MSPKHTKALSLCQVSAHCLPDAQGASGGRDVRTSPSLAESILLWVSGLKGIYRGYHKVSIRVLGILGSWEFRVQGFLGLGV